MTLTRELPAATAISDRIHVVRNQRVILDADLAVLYRVSSRRLAEQVRRNPNRFPPDFMFRLTGDELAAILELRPNLAKVRSSRMLPRAFSEHGTLMVANVLNSEAAVQVSIEIVRAFVAMRRVIAEHLDLRTRVDALEERYDGQFREVFDAIRELMTSDDQHTRSIGFRSP